MTVAELRALLADLPGDMPVAVDGYEAGLTVEAVFPRVVGTRHNPRGPRARYEGELCERDGPLTGRTWPEGPSVFLLSRHDEDE